MRPMLSVSSGDGRSSGQVLALELEEKGYGWLEDGIKEEVA